MVDHAGRWDATMEVYLRVLSDSSPAAGSLSLADARRALEALVPVIEADAYRRAYDVCRNVASWAGLWCAACGRHEFGSGASECVGRIRALVERALVERAKGTP